MTYVVTVETCIPDGAAELDALGRFGAVVLLERGFGSVAGVEGPDGAAVDVFDVTVAAHPGGAVLTVSVGAPTLETAEDAVGAVTQEVLDRAEQLTGWLVLSSEVRLHTELARESLAAADGPGAPPSDPALRRARHTARPGAGPQAPRPWRTPRPEDGDGPDVLGALASLGGLSSPGGYDGPGSADDDHDPWGLAGHDRAPGDPGDDEDADLWADVVEEAPDPETELRFMASRLRAFDPAVFAASGDTAALAAGALVHAAEVLIDELYDDVQVLAEEDTDVASCEGHLWHLGRLPVRPGSRYDELFARRFLVTAVALTTRFTDGSFRRLGCPAEDMVLRFLLEQARVALDLYGLLDEAVATALDRFGAHVRKAAGPGPHGCRETSARGGAAGWFAPFDGERYVHPYALDAYETEPGPEKEGPGTS
ncbi:hypothetical protein AB0C52_15200 [Streptomyces sp. NPDC048717]|uniref:hypothetical protein n=1 Tax=Streptomyces sp. NPDC048717 TaxID=3154928 RepID=UPI00343C5BB9